MYFLVLAALLQIDDLAPKPYAFFKTERECFDAARNANKEHADQLNDEEGTKMGLRFVCLKVVAEQV
jgi:hypothetical protein